MTKDRGTRTPKRYALVGQLIEILRENIHNGTWPVGSRLPVEAELAEDFGVSRVTLRQAVQALVHVGLLETIQGNGTYVRATSELDAVMKRYLAAEAIDSVLEVRLAIESEAAALAAARADAADLERLEAIVQTSRAALDSGNLQLLATQSLRFHRAVVQAAHNPVLLHFYGALREGTERSIREDAELDRFPVFVDEHTQLFDALRRKDSERARALARAHLVPLIGPGTSASPGGPNGLLVR